MNATFTRRVGHEAGRQHPAHATREPFICGTCGAVYMNRRWAATNIIGRNSLGAHLTHARTTTCPASKQELEGLPGGFVHLGGAFFAVHRQEIERLLRNEVDRAAEDNPLAKIMDWESIGERKLTLKTTTEHLAQRLGHALGKAFGGDLHNDFSHENRLARVSWHRNWLSGPLVSGHRPAHSLSLSLLLSHEGVQSDAS